MDRRGEFRVFWAGEGEHRKRTGVVATWAAGERKSEGVVGAIRDVGDALRDEIEGEEDGFVGGG